MKKKENKELVILVEGIDLSGKSTLVNLLAKEYPGIVIKNTMRPDDGTEDETEKIKRVYTYIIDTIFQTPSYNVILDRFYPSELVYSQVKRGYEAFDDPFYTDLEDRIKNDLMDQNVFLILCKPPVETIIERFAIRDEDFIKKAEVEEIYERYESFFEGSALENKLALDTRDTVESLLEQVVNFIEGNEHEGNNKPEQGSLFGR